MKRNKYFGWQVYEDITKLIKSPFDRKKFIYNKWYSRKDGFRVIINKSHADLFCKSISQVFKNRTFFVKRVKFDGQFANHNLLILGIDIDIAHVSSIYIYNINPELRTKKSNQLKMVDKKK